VHCHPNRSLTSVTPAGLAVDISNVASHKTNMASHTLDDEGNPPRLKLEHDGGFPDARQTGRILDRLANAYRGYTRLGIQSPEAAADLVIEHMDVGSLLVVFRDVLETASAVLTLYDHRELMGGFVAQLTDALSLMARVSGEPLPMFRTAIEALSAPVRKGSASRVTLTVIGDNNRILIIDRASAADVQRFLDMQPQSVRDRSDEPRTLRRRVRRPKQRV
jgi:hypothetical protein